MLRLGVPSSGLRTYLGVRGGIAVDQVLGSRSTDLLADLGPPQLAEGDVLPVGPEPAEFPLLDVAPVTAPAGRDGDAARGARTAGRPVRRTEGADPHQVDRVQPQRPGGDAAGGRQAASGPAKVELPSEGMVRGAVQVPPGGEPVLFLADHPVTGGYPVVAVVLDADVDRAAQVRPGQSVRFTFVPPPS